MSAPDRLQAAKKESSHSRDPRGTFLFAPYEFAVTGLPGSGKTALAEALIEHFTRESGQRYRVGYVKQEPGEPQLAAERTDATRARNAGALITHLLSEHGSAWLDDSATDERTRRALLRNRWQDVDFVIAEGFAAAPIPKIVVVGEDARILDEVAAGMIPAITGFAVSDQHVAARRRCEQIAGSVPVYSATAIGQIAGHILATFAERYQAVPLYGLVLSGGKSSRMKRDKGEIDYHGEPQVRHVHRLLEQFCERVLVSVRSRKASYRGLPLIVDTFRGLGPTGGILTAMHTYPEAAWLVVGCDMPFVTAATVGELLAQRDPLRGATAFVSAADGFPEPLCTVYEPAFRARFHQFLSIGIDCPRKALINSNVNRLSPSDPHALSNVNTPDEYRSAVERLQRAAEGAHR